MDIWMIIAVISAVTFVGSLGALPVILVRLPEDYFVRLIHGKGMLNKLNKPWRWIFLILKNIFGLILVIAGIIMFFIPGQGLITLLLGLCFMNFPKKKELMKWLLNLKKVRQFINSLRRRYNKPPMQMP